MEQPIIPPIYEQINTLLDGRTQRWLALRVRIPEGDLSKKLNGKMPFTDDEIKDIATLLKAKIKKPKNKLLCGLRK